MTATQKHDIIPICTTVLSADQPPKEDIMLDQQKITILYCRLSNEDAQEGESNSIANQREYLTRYARDHGYTNLKILVDDGYTGTNFNRPGVQEGFELVKQGLVGCWLVKDLSRFGRDYLTVGQYTDIIFPSYDVRFIAINDGVDSNRGDSEGFAAIRNLFNEWYPRDTSKKVRVSLRQRGTSGKHMGKPPYGYRCDPEDKDHWILDEEAAPVVKLIFDLCIDGKGPEQIARILEEKQIMTAKALYAKRKKKPMPERPYHWGNQSIAGILERQEYTGCTCNFKSYSNSKLNKLNLKEGEIEVIEDNSIFNKHLDEILYFFQVTDYNVVIIEDLDRFGTPSIFLKLRELNQLINESKIVGRHITFIYAIKDDIFKDEERTKFFDFITTVIPVINPSNSKDKLKSALEAKGCGNDGISDEDLSEMAFFIQDMRILTNIVNEYKQYRDKLCEASDFQLNKTKLLGMIVYKNYYPQDFALLRSEEHTSELQSRE